jgi:hypothetical protein
LRRFYGFIFAPFDCPVFIFWVAAYFYFPAEISSDDPRISEIHGTPSNKAFIAVKERKEVFN